MPGRFTPPPPPSLPVILALEMDAARSFLISSVYTSLALICDRLLTTLNTPAVFASMLVAAFRTFLLWSLHVTLGLGNHLLPLAVMAPPEKVKTGAS